jgi:hypothetical protein
VDLGDALVLGHPVALGEGHDLDPGLTQPSGYRGSAEVGPVGSCFVVLLPRGLSLRRGLSSHSSSIASSFVTVAQLRAVPCAGPRGRLSSFASSLRPKPSGVCR